ncbi:MAG: hypothetical protein Q4B26_07450 [Eubacteriales bacterium]|nr:hypothetical protein [Eubacteriales bacterium]
MEVFESIKAIGTQEVKTERLLLRKFRAEDVTAVYENYGSDPKVKEYISFAPCATLEGAEGFI